MSSVINFGAKLLIILAILQMSHGGRPTKKPKRIQGSRQQAEKILTQRIKSATPEELAKAQEEASKKLQSNLEMALVAITAKDAKIVPPEVQESATKVLSAIQLGQLTETMVNSLPEIMVQISSKAGPAQQLQTILGATTARAPLELKAPLQGVMDFLKANVNGVNNLLSRVINGTPNLTQGVVSSLANTLGGVNGVLTGTMDSLNGLVGGLLSGGLLPTGLLPQLPGLGSTGGLLG